ncbi:MAG: M1 family metallopeptidase [Bacteroidia bacterium]|nr:M1 family metallopeptidase [Bacteroidia bacterium]
MLRYFILVIGLFSAFTMSSQVFTQQDTLRGSVTPERAWWDLTYYHLDIAVNPSDSTIVGSNTIHFKVVDHSRSMQIDLQPPMKITSISQSGKELSWKSFGNAHYVMFEQPLLIGTRGQIIVEYEGRPQVSLRPPWSGGFTWARDMNDLPFVATSCQGDGASLWWPCKDHPKDEVDSMLISVTYPDHLMNVSNGRLRGLEKNGDGTHTTHWYVDNPINAYGVNVNIGDYVHFAEQYEGEKGQLDCDYYVLKDNLEKAKKQFEQVPMMFEAFEHWFGPYPFYEDGFKLVEVPYLGMEHQSSVTYGNGYQNGYLGRDLSGTGEGLKFDFIIIHEAGHEWFANSITNQDIADMWVHEGFTAYSENLYLDYHFGTRSSADYVIGTRNNIRNDKPIIGKYNVNNSGSGDMYYKGSNLLHTIRRMIGDDEKWRSIMRGLNNKFYHQTVTSSMVEQYIIDKSGLPLETYFDQYLRDTRIPVLEYHINKRKLQYRWTNCVDGFTFPVEVKVGKKQMNLSPTDDWQSSKIPRRSKTLSVDRDYFVEVSKVAKIK